jgi:Rrf2 family transcriptional regulator, iron-sulfur cluster assembly transcription factor
LEGRVYKRKDMFSKSCKYAIRAVLFLAINTNADHKMGVEEIGTELEIPKHFLAKILQQLTKTRIVSSAKGRNGGFYLSKENKSSNLMTVILSFDGPGVFSDCIIGLNNCSNENPCPYHNSVQKYRNQFLAQLQNETIEATALRVNKQNLKI